METLLGTAKVKEKQGEKRRRQRRLDLASGREGIQESRGCGCESEQCMDMKTSPTVMGIGALSTVEPGSLQAIHEGWRELDLTVDSGASETVMAEEDLPNTKTKEGSAYKRGVEFEVANGTRIANEGEKTFNTHTSGGSIRTITAQICDVNKPLLSVRKIVESGNRVVFEPHGSYIQDGKTQEKTKLDIVGGMYTLEVWVKEGEKGICDGEESLEAKKGSDSP